MNPLENASLYIRSHPHGTHHRGSQNVDRMKAHVWNFRPPWDPPSYRSEKLAHIAKENV